MRIFGAVGDGAPYFHNIVVGEAPFVGGFLGFLNILLIAGFSFQGLENIRVSAGESSAPSESVQRAVKIVFFAICGIYVVSLFVIGCILPYTDPNLLGGSDDISVSPFTLIFQQIGISFAKDIVNAVILIAVLSAGLSCTYSATRLLQTLAQDHRAPAFFAKVTSKGNPIFSLIGTGVIYVLVFLISLIGPEFYGYLLDATSLSGFIDWFVIAISHFRFRRGFLKQGHDISELTYYAALYPFGPIFGATVCVLVIVFQNVPTFQDQNFTSIFCELYLCYSFYSLIFFI